MLNLNCVICAEIFSATDDVYVTHCGHMFHHSCLIQWLERSKSCPQCRNRCTERSILRVYFNMANLDVSHIDVGSLQEQLDNANLLLKMKEREVKKAEQHVKDLKETQRKCLKTIAGLEQKKQQNEFVILSYTEQIKMLKVDATLVEGVRKQVTKLTQQIEEMDGVSAILAASAKDAERLLRNESDPKILSVWVATLKRELRQSEHKRYDVRNVLKVVQNDLRKELEVKRNHEERISQLESENYRMAERLKVLEVKETNESQNSTIDLTKNALASILRDARRATISPTVKENVKLIEESNSPYLNIKASSVGLAPLLKRPLSTTSALSKLRISPIKSCSGDGVTMTNGSLRKTSSDLSDKYSIFKKPRLVLPTSINGAKGAMKPLASNYAFNGFGGSEKIDPFARDNDMDEVQIVEAPIKPNAKTLNERLKAGGLRNFKVPK